MGDKMKEEFIEVAHLIMSKNNVSFDLGYFKNLNQLTKLLNIIHKNNNMKLVQVQITWQTLLSTDDKITIF